MRRPAMLDPPDVDLFYLVPQPSWAVLADWSGRPPPRCTSTVAQDPVVGSWTRTRWRYSSWASLSAILWQFGTN
ncbi:MAG: hypothetical protein ACRDQ6_12965, partial [Pseudonocardiaceae bacterium]